MSEHASSSVNISAITAADALDKLRITNIFRKLTSADVERVRRLLFRRCNDSVLPCARGKTTLRPIFMIREQDNDRIKRLCVSKFKVRVDSVCVAATPQHGLREDIHVEGEGKIAVVVDGLILGVAPHAGIWRAAELLPHFKPGPKEWRGPLYSNIFFTWSNIFLCCSYLVDTQYFKTDRPLCAWKNSEKATFFSMFKYWHHQSRNEFIGKGVLALVTMIYNRTSKIARNLRSGPGYCTLISFQ